MFAGQKLALAAREAATGLKGSDLGFAGLGGIGKRGSSRLKSLEFHTGRDTDFSRLVASKRREQLVSSGKKRAMFGVAGVGAIGLSSGASGMSAKSSGGMTG